MNRYLLHSYALWLALAIAVVACQKAAVPAATSTEDQDIPLAETENIRDMLSLPTYGLFSLNGRALKASESEGIFIRIDKQAQRANGRAGCNLFNGAISENDGGNWMLGNVATSRMSCNRLELETEILRAFREADYFEEIEEKLTFVSGRNKLMVWNLKAEKE